MQMIHCPNCGQLRGFRRALGFGTLFVVVLTCGIWLLAIPFYPQRCIQCGLTRRSAWWYSLTPQQRKIVGAVGIVAGLVILAFAIFSRENFNPGTADEWCAFHSCSLTKVSSASQTVDSPSRSEPDQHSVQQAAATDEGASPSGNSAPSAPLVQPAEPGSSVQPVTPAVLPESVQMEQHKRAPLKFECVSDSPGKLFCEKLEASFARLLAVHDEYRAPNLGDNGDKLYALISASVKGSPTNINGYPAFVVGMAYCTVERQDGGLGGGYVIEPVSGGIYVVIDAPDNAWHIPADVMTIDRATSEWLYGMTKLINRPYGGY